MKSRKSNYRYTGIILIMMFLISLSLLQKNANATANNIDEVSIEVPVACTLTSTINVEHNTSAKSGQYKEDIGETAFNATCNDSDGFAIYAVGFSNDEYGNNTMVPTNNPISNAIATGLNTSGATSNWAMKLTSVSENFSITSGYNAYHEVPDDFTKVASYPSNTTTIAGVQIKSTYATYISAGQAADTYTGKVKYTLVHPADADAPIKDISDISYIQEFASLSAQDVATVIASMEENTAYDFVDARDDQVYKIAKLKDGRVWMLDNLNLGAIPLTDNLTPENTNIGVPVSSSVFNGWKKETGGDAYFEGIYAVVDGTDSTTGTKYGVLYNYFAASGGTYAAKYNSIGNATHDICPAGWRLPTGGSSGEFQTLYDSGYGTDSSMHVPISDGGAAFALAGYFSGTSQYSKNSSGYFWSSTSSSSGGTAMGILNVSSYGSASTNSTSDRIRGRSIRCILKNPVETTIHLGEGISSVEIDDRIITSDTTITLERNATHTIGANFDASHAMGSWSATSGTIGYANSRYTTFTPNSKVTTISVTATNATPTAMQNMSPASCSSNISYAYDNRDNQIYAIKRLNDGNCWMLDNLNLGATNLTTNLTSDNTNLSSTIAASTFNGWRKSLTEWTPFVYPAVNDTGGYYSMNDADHTSGTKYGTLYNYYVASAGTILGSSNSNNASYDICPAGWRLPTGGSNGEFQTLYSSYDSYEKMRNPAVAGGAAFASAGYYTSNSPSYQDYKTTQGRYWSSTVAGSNLMYTLKTDIGVWSAPSADPANSSQRGDGLSIRCIMKQSGHALTVNFGTGISGVTVNDNPIISGSTIVTEEGVEYNIIATVAPGYGFDGWSATSGTIDLASAQAIKYTAGPNNASITASASYVSTEMQNLSSASCTSTATKVRDTRDNHVYTIKHLNDGKCWMLDNLDLGRSDLTTDLTSSNTNLSSTITASTFNGWRIASTAQTTSTGEFASIDGIDPISKSAYGTLYNYYAASAGTISGSSNSNNASYDLCPAGWRMPTSNTSGDFRYLYDNYNTNSLLRSPVTSGGLALALSGDWYTGTPRIGRSTILWSSTNGGTEHMFAFYLEYYSPSITESSTPDVNYKDYVQRTRGAAIRCVLK